MAKFDTTIPAYGPAGNIFAILGTATHLLKEIGVSKAEIAELRDTVMGAQSYDDACAAVEEWFPLEKTGRV